MDFAHGYLLALTALAFYVVGISLMTTQVSYPLYASVPREAFVDLGAYRTLRLADAIRTAACLLSTGALAASVLSAFHPQ